MASNNRSNNSTATSSGKPSGAEEAKVSNKSKKAKASQELPEALWAQFRPKQRVAVFAVFLSICVSIAIFYDTCDVRKKKQDCGYPGVSALECRTTACFLKGGGEMEKKKITLKRKKGIKFGLISGSKKEDKDIFIKGVKEGAVADYNAGADPEDRIEARDTILSIDGATGSELRKKLSSASSETVVIEFKRSKLPSYLKWLHQGTKPGRLEKLLTAPGAKNWFEVFSKLGGVGFFLWYMSGYPATSLPFYYFGVSGLMAWHTSRCCHDSQVSGGVPHCYRGGSAKFSVALTRLQTRANDAFAKMRKEPRTYFKSFLWNSDFEKWLS